MALVDDRTRNPPPSSRRLTRVEWVALGASIAFWIASAALPEGIAVVPEYVTLHNILLLSTALVAFAVPARHMWRWLRWWSIAIDVVVPGLTLLPLGLIAEDLISQLQPAPSEGFFYRGGFGICGTHVASKSQMRGPGIRVYVLQEYCVPDGAERRAEYVRHGASPLMHEVPSGPGTEGRRARRIGHTLKRCAAMCSQVSLQSGIDTFVRWIRLRSSTSVRSRGPGTVTFGFPVQLFVGIGVVNEQRTNRAEEL